MNYIENKENKNNNCNLEQRSSTPPSEPVPNLFREGWGAGQVFCFLEARYHDLSPSGSDDIVWRDGRRV